jgi:acyl-coenzyme A thioesterase PaaI-like protein
LHSFILHFSSKMLGTASTMRMGLRQAAGARRLATSTAAPRRANVARSTATFLGVVGASSYAGYAFAKALQPTAVPRIADLPEETQRAHVAEVEAQIARHPVVAALRAREELVESRPHTKVHPVDRPHNLTAGTLAGPGRITVAPYVFGDRAGTQLYVVAHLGADLCGHDGIIHGGLLATLLDEGLARCCFPALPNKIGVTANLVVDYRKPTKANQLVMLKANTTKVEGRKAWVEGSIVSLATDNEGDTLVQAKALFIEPKYAALMKRVVRTDHLE